jgi:acyl transferase domain-containing protein/3-hydroxymyristoyl/3-hydroxydecanoyl-(acyl carrier protein) dehydratase
MSRVAIVGIGGVFPGAVDLNKKESMDGTEKKSFWEIIARGESVADEPPPGRWALGVDEVYSPNVAADKVRSRRACFADDRPADADGLQINPDLLSRLDPVFHTLLRAGIQAWRDAMTGSVDRGRVGVIVGNIVLSTDSASALADEIFLPEFERQGFGATAGINPAARATEPLNKFAAGLPASVLAKALGLGGGGYTLDAACASSLYAIKLAVDELLAGRADAMLAGGVSRPDSLYTQMGFSQLGALSPSSRCAPFDADADGLVVGEGAGIVVLKRLDDALADGDRIYATIAGIGLSNDIGGNLMLPDSEGQVRAMRQAYRQAGWSPRDIDLIECHGTGTPTGDAVEFGSLSELWSTAEPPDREARQRCVLGSVKSNVGHLLTAAGAAGLIKVLLALRNELLPPTANFARPAGKIDLESSPFQVLARPKAWSRRDKNVPRRAAVSAFGFGGINAHLLLEEWLPRQNEALVPCPRRDPSNQVDDSAAVAIVGIDAACGPWRSLAAVRQRLFADRSENSDEPSLPDAAAFRIALPDGVTTWSIDAVEIPVGRFRIPPNELADMLPQQLLMLQVAANAWEDFAGCPLADQARLRTGVFIGIGLDLNTTNFHFRWNMANHARAWSEKRGLSTDDDATCAWIDALRDAASAPLTANRTMGALGGIVASRIARALRVGGPSFTISSEETSGIHTLAVAAGALRRGEVDTAVVGAVDIATDPRAVAAEVAVSASRVFSDGAAAFILKRYDDAIRDRDRVYAVIRDIGAANPAANAASNVADRIGHCGAASGFFSALGAVLSIADERCLASDASGRRASSYWLHNRSDGPRRATVVSAGIHNNSLSVTLEEPAAARKSRPPSTLKDTILALTASSRTDLIQRIRDTRSLITDEKQNVHALARRIFHEFPPQAEHATAVAMVVDREQSPRDLLDEVESLVASDTEALGPNIFYQPRPLATGGTAAASGLALVFPGAGNQYLGMGRELAGAFPDVVRQLEAENERLAAQFADGRFWTANSLDEIAPKDVAFGQVWLGSLVADVLAVFGVRPGAVIGYSLGESAGLFALRAWRDRDEMLRRMEDSTLFTRDLAGECRAARRAWRLADDDEVDWSIGVVNRPVSAVRQALVGRERVYLLIVNTPSQCVIGGDRRAVNDFVAALGCGFHPLTGVTTVHCEVARPVAEAYRALHLLPTDPPENVRFYSGALGRAYDLTSAGAADSIVEQAIGPFEFPRVIEKAYADGVRIFVETGPGNSCTRMISQILANRPHATIAACADSDDEPRQMLRAVAELIAHRVPVNLSRLLDDRDDRFKLSADTKQPLVKVACHRGPFNVPKPPPPPRSPAIPPVKPVEYVSPRPRTDRWLAAPSQMLERIATTEAAKISTEAAFLAVSQAAIGATQRLVSRRADLVARAARPSTPTPAARPLLPAFDRAACLEFARGSIARVLGDEFAEIDGHPTRVRLPDEPLMLVDRILSIEGARRSLGSGRAVTEHDILPAAWYLDAGRIPTCIAVEAGQADLFLSGYLGIDFATRGRAVYRLLDAVVTFHRDLPGPNETIRYDIHIDRFFRQGQTHLFRFRFEATVGGQPLLSMRDGCAGFFTEEELAAGQGVVQTSMDRREMPGRRPEDWRDLAPLDGTESYDDRQIDAFRRGDLAGCFGQMFTKLPLVHPAGLPGGRMNLVHRVLRLEPRGGRFGLGQIVGEADIHPDDWFLTCHFVDDRVMPGTLMYECCLHTLRIFLARLGWVGEANEVAFQPVPGVASQLKCRGQVVETTQKVQYELSIKEIGYLSEGGTPYVKADALMYADGRPIVQMHNMSLRLTGLTRAKVEAMWCRVGEGIPQGPGVGGRGSGVGEGIRLPQHRNRPAALFGKDRILAFAIGKPSDAFGEPYRVFDRDRVIARLPGPPYQFLDRIVSIADCRPWELRAGGVIEAEYDVPPDGWYFAANRMSVMPFAVLLEIALQPCGWLAAYLGSALVSDVDLSFRNLGGRGVQRRRVTPDSGTLTTTVKITKVSQSGGMIIEHFEFAVRDGAGEIYSGDTYFGFFTKPSLTNQVGIRDAAPFEPSATPREHNFPKCYPGSPPYPDDQLRMVDRIVRFDPLGGPIGLGFIRGEADVKPDAWFFKAHFYQDPVWPGSLGLESFLQLLKHVAIERWGWANTTVDAVMLDSEHRWTYRGQILPADRLVTVQAVIDHIDDGRRTLWASGHLWVDGRVIYQMNDFSVRMEPHAI